MRFAAALVGGTSLAIYENGVAQELYRLVRGEGLYGELKRATRTEAYVDVLAGTSAGGINAILLAAALANGRSFKDTSKIWGNKACLTSRQNSPRELLHLASSKEATTVLQGDAYFTTELIAEMNKVVSGPLVETELGSTHPSGYRDDARQDYERIELFVTGTHYLAPDEGFVDDRGYRLNSADHRAVFHFNLNSLRSPGIAEKLGRVARTTASLPAVFEPTRMKSAEYVKHGWKRWPPVPTVEAPSHEHIMFDGGYRVGKPLDLLVRGIVNQPATRAVKRKVILVDPTPEPPSERQWGGPEGESPDALQSLLFYFNTSGEQSLSDAFEYVRSHNEKVRQYHEMLQALRTQTTAASSQDRAVLSKVRRARVRDKLVDLAFQRAREESREFLRTRFQEALTAKASDVALLNRLDPYYAARFVLRAIDELYNFKPADARAAERELGLELLYKLYFTLVEFAEQSYAAMACALREQPLDKVDLLQLAEAASCGKTSVYDKVVTYLGAHDKRPLFQELLKHALEAQSKKHHIHWLVARSLAALQLQPSPGDAQCGGFEPLFKSRKTPSFHDYLAYLELLDVRLYPVELAADLVLTDPIRLLEISPPAASGLANRPEGAELSGDALSKFGGFFKQSWRINDIMMGRLDASAVLLDALVDDRWEAVLAAQGDDFPLLRQALGPGVGDRSQLLRALVEASHAEILQDKECGLAAVYASAQVDDGECGLDLKPEFYARVQAQAARETQSWFTDKKGYQIGKETLAQMPPVYLANLIGRAIAVMSNVARNSPSVPSGLSVWTGALGLIRTVWNRVANPTLFKLWVGLLLAAYLAALAGEAYSGGTRFSPEFFFKTAGIIQVGSVFLFVFAAPLAEARGLSKDQSMVKLEFARDRTEFYSAAGSTITDPARKTFLGALVGDDKFFIWAYASLLLELAAEAVRDVHQAFPGFTTGAAIAALVVVTIVVITDFWENAELRQLLLEEKETFTGLWWATRLKWVAFFGCLGAVGVAFAYAGGVGLRPPDAPIDRQLALLYGSLLKLLAGLFMVGGGVLGVGGVLAGSATQTTRPAMLIGLVGLVWLLLRNLPISLSLCLLIGGLGSLWLGFRSARRQ